jgi:hypothetical protein
MSDITSIDQTYRLYSNGQTYGIEIGKFTCLAPDTNAYADGCNIPSGANGLFLGIAQESIIPNSMADYSGGQYTITSGTAWPAGSIPVDSKGRNVRVRQFGISRVVAAGQITRNDLLIIADVYGRAETCPAVGGTTYNVIGRALDAATNSGDVIRVLVAPFTYKA